MPTGIKEEKKCVAREESYHGVSTTTGENYWHSTHMQSPPGRASSPVWTQKNTNRIQHTPPPYLAVPSGLLVHFFLAAMVAAADPAAVAASGFSELKLSIDFRIGLGCLCTWGKRGSCMVEAGARRGGGGCRGDDEAGAIDGRDGNDRPTVAGVRTGKR